MFGLAIGLGFDAGMNGGPLVLPVTSGLLAHWDASKLVASGGDGTAVTSWTDIVSSIVATGSGPVYRATGAPNGRMPAIECGSAHGASSGLSIASGLPTAGTTRTTVIACKPSALMTGGAFVSFGDSNAGVWFLHLNLNGSNYVGGDLNSNETIASAPANASSTYTHGYTVGSQLTVRINGVSQTVSGAALNGSSFGGAGVIGNRFTGVTQPFEGTLMEIAIYNRTLSSVEAAAIEGYYSAKWY